MIFRTVPEASFTFQCIYSEVNFCRDAKGR